MAVFVVTGARGGIGLEYIRQIAKTEDNTALAVVRNLKGNLKALETIKAESPGVVHIVECDVSSEQAIATLPQKLETLLGSDEAKIDFFINNAAILHSKEETGLTVTSEALLSHIQTNVIGPAALLKTLLPYLRQSSSAVVANITSGAGSLTMLSDGRIIPNITPYSISKTALNMLTVHQASELKDQGVIVVCVDPGHVKTEMAGPGAVLEPTDSASGVLAVLKRLEAKDAGKFFLYNGDQVDW